MQTAFPMHVGKDGRTAMANEEEHIRHLIEQLLFTSPGERVNRPDFGSGLMQLVFAPNSSEIASATQYLVQGSLQQWLGDRIQVQAVEVENQDSTLHIAVRYATLPGGEPKSVEFHYKA